MKTLINGIREFFKQSYEDRDKINKKGNLKESLNIQFKEELIDIEFNNVGTYKKGSRTKIN